MTKFAFEVPIPHLNDFHRYQDFIFTLSILYEDPDYLSYLLKVKEEGLKTIWLDNSFNETFEVETPEKLYKLSLCSQASKVICPDHINWNADRLAESFRAMHKLGINKAQLLGVASDFESFKRLYNEGCTTIGVSYWVRSSWTYEQLLQVKDKCQLHFLGLNDMIELRAVQPHSCDTSMPIKLALQGQSLRNWAEQGYPHINTKDLGLRGRAFFQADLSPLELQLSFDNIQLLRHHVKRYSD